MVGGERVIVGGILPAPFMCKSIAHLFYYGKCNLVQRSGRRDRGPQGRPPCREKSGPSPVCRAAPLQTKRNFGPETGLFTRIHRGMMRVQKKPGLSRDLTGRSPLHIANRLVGRQSTRLSPADCADRDIWDPQAAIGQGKLLEGFSNGWPGLFLLLSSLSY